MTRAPRKINHVGLAVPDIEAFLRKTAPLYEGFSRGPMIVNERQKVRELYVTDGATTVELLEPLGEGSPLQAFLNRNPTGGLIHLALEVTNLDAAIARVTAAGGRLPGSGRGLPRAQDRFRLSRRSGHRIDRTPTVGMPDMIDRSHCPGIQCAVERWEIAAGQTR